MQDESVRMTNDDLIKKIDDLKNILNNYQNHNEKINSLHEENNKLNKSITTIKTLGFILSFIFALVIHANCFISFVLFYFNALKKELQVLDNNKQIEYLEEEDKKNYNLIKEKIKNYERILAYRKDRTIENNILRNLNINIQNISDVSYDLQQMNHTYLNTVIDNSNLEDITKITNLIIDYFNNQDKKTVDDEPNQVQKKLK